MNRLGLVATVVVAVAMISSAMAFPLLGGGFATADDDAAGGGDEVGDEHPPGVERDAPAEELTAIPMEPTAQTQDEPAAEYEDAIEDGVDEGIDLVQAQGVEVTQEQRAAAVEGALESVAQHQEAEIEQVQKATAGAVHGTLVQDQDVEVEQVQAAVGGATDGTLAQYQTVNATQMQHAAWGATHGAIAQKQVVTVEQLQVATQGAAAGAAFEAGEKDVAKPGKIQEAAQGAAYGVVSQYQKITVEQRQQVTLEHVQHAAAGASAGALEGAQEQRVEVEQYQAVTIKQVQKAAKGAAKGALVQRQEVTVEQTQAAARGAAKGPLEKVQEVRIEQVQRVTITQIQEASFGAAKGAIYQSQAATVEQIQAAAVGSSGGVLVQKQEVSITQIQKAAFGSSKGAVIGAIQHQVVEVEQIQAAAFGAGEGAVIQKQAVDVTQVQVLAEGASSGVLAQAQVATAEQLQVAASGAGQASAQVIQYQRVSVTQVQILVSATAADATDYAVDAEIDLEELEEVLAFALTEAEQRSEEIDELEGEASVTFAEQDSDGETVVVEDVFLSEGGFLAIHDEAFFEGEVDSVRGVSEYLEPGDHEEVEIELEEPITEERTLTAIAHLDTTGDEEFTYVETDGEADVPYVDLGGSPIYDEAVVAIEDPDVIDSAPEAEGALEVTDHEIDVDPDEEYVTLRNVVDAPLEMTGWTVEGEDEQAGENEPYTFPDGFTLEPDAEVTLVTGEGEDTDDTLYRGLEQPAWDETGDTVIVRDAAGETLLESELEPDVPDLEATLTADDQEGDGETLVVEEASAPEEYVVAVVDEDGEEIGQSEVFDAEQVVEDLEVALDPPLEEDATLDVEVRAVEDDEVLASETIEYVLEDVPEATLSVTDQEGDGETVVVEEASAPEEYYLAAIEDGEMVGESEIFDAEQVVEDLEVALDPPLETDTTLDVEVRSAEDDEVLASETITYTLEEVPVASVVFEDQDSDGTTVTVDSADVPEGGFVAVYEEDVLPEGAVLEDLEPENVDPEAVIGVSEYLEPGEYEDLEVELFDVPGLEFEDEEALAAGEQELIAVAHEDTGETETFEFVETDGEEDGPSVDEDGVVVADDALVTVEPELPDATLTVDDQEGDGETLLVEEASAPEAYTLVVVDEAGTEIGESEVFDAEMSAENLEIVLEPPLETDAALDVEVRSAEDDEVLASETITYTLEDVPVASVVLEDQDSNGTAVTVDSADVPEGGFVAVYEEDVLPEDVVLEDLEPEDVDPEAVIGVSEYLEPGEYEDLEVELFDVPGLEFEDDALEDGEQVLIAVAHEDTAETETFEFAETDGEEDGPYIDGDGVVVADDALVTVEPDVLEPEVAFLSCTEAEVTGDVEGIGYVQEFYLEEGFANQVAAPQFPWDELADGENATIVQIGPEADAWIEDDGTRIVQIEDEGAFPSTETGTASILRAIELPGDEDSPEDEGTFGPLVENPEGDDCLDEVRPDLPDLSVEETEPADDGIDVTFGYENPNEATITAPAEFEGTTDAEPPADLESGMATFTVEWTPEDDDEQLVWSVDMTGHGYDDPITVSTPTAGEIAPTEPAAFAVAITGTNAPIEPGETLEVETTVENVGGEAGTQELDLSLDGTTVDTAEASLEAGEVGSVALSTVIDEPGEYDLEVASDDDSDGTTITVDAPAIFAVTGLSAPGSAQVGETIEVSATIENQGDLEGTGTVTYAVDGIDLEQEGVTLSGGESTTVAFTYTVPEEQAGTAPIHQVSTEDDTATVPIPVEPEEPEPEPPEEPAD